MKLKLIVLAGAKEGLEIPLKKDKFLIGRAKECALRAGSEAISRRHCAITKHEDGYTVRDLGSRNGTYVNDARIEREVPLFAGNELRVGPLKFRVEPLADKASKEVAAPVPAESSAAAEPAPAASVAEAKKPRKQPPVKDVAEVVQRTISMSDSTTEDDVSRWLLGINDLDGPETLKETRSLRAEDTRTNISKPSLGGDSATVEDIAALTKAEGEEAEGADHESDEAPAEAEKAEGGTWGWLKFGKGGTAKKKPGKLPQRPGQASKDTREAAADILREMQRRR